MMTGKYQTTEALDAAIAAVPDELRESVSALCDGELSRSETAFLLKRMENDEALLALWERYQCVGHGVRGHDFDRTEQEFTSRIMGQIANEPAPRSAESTVRKNEPQAANDGGALVYRGVFRRAAVVSALAATVAGISMQMGLFSSATPELSPALAGAHSQVNANQAAPIVASQSVNAVPVSNRLDARPTLQMDATSSNVQLDSYLLEHGASLGGRSIAPVVYSVSEADAGYIIASQWNQ